MTMGVNMKNKNVLVLALSAGLILSVPATQVKAAELPSESLNESVDELVKNEKDQEVENNVDEGKVEEIPEESEEETADETTDQSSTEEVSTENVSETPEEIKAENSEDILEEQVVDANAGSKEEVEVQNAEESSLELGPTTYAASVVAAEDETTDPADAPENQEVSQEYVEKAALEAAKSNIPEAKPSDNTYEVTPTSKRKDYVDIRQVFDDFKSDKEAFGEVVKLLKEKHANNQAVATYISGFENIDPDNITDEDIERAYSTVPKTELLKGMFIDGKALIDYIYTEYEKKEDIIVYDDTLEFGTSRIDIKGQEGYTKYLVTEGAPSSFWKIGGFYTSDEINQLAKSNNKVQFNEIERHTLEEISKSTELLNKFFGDEGIIRPKYKDSNTIDPETGKTITGGKGVKIDPRDFRKEAKARKIAIGTNIDNLEKVPYKTIEEKSDQKYLDDPAELLQEGRIGLRNDKGEMVLDTIDKIILVGTKQLDIVPFKTIKEDDSSLYVGEEEVSQEGETGTGKTVDGSLQIVTEPVDEIIKVGTKPLDKIEYETIEEENSDLYEGERKVSREGKNGTGKTKDGNQEVIESPVDEIVQVGTKPLDVIEYETIEEENADLYEGEREVSREGKNGTGKTKDGNQEVIEAPVDEIVQVGTKPLDKIEYETIEEENADLYEGERKVSREGKNGTGKTKDGNQEVIESPVDEIVQVGTKPLDVIEYETIEEENADLYEGEREVSREGKNGTGKTKDGNQEVIEAPVDEIVQVGTKPLEVVDFETKREDDSSLYVGEEEVSREGKKGTSKKTASGDIEVVDQPVDKIIKVGTKPLDVIEYETIEEENSDLYVGEREVSKEGKNGTGKTKDGNQEVIEAPVDEIVQVGTKPLETIEFKKTEQRTPDLYIGETKISQEGKNGSGKYDSNGNLTVVEEPVDEITLIGTKERATRPIPYQEIVEEDPTMYVDEEPIVKQQGKEGLEKEVSEGNWEVVEEPINKITVVGTKEYATEDIAFETIRQADPDKYVDEAEEVIQEGKVGKRQEQADGTWVDIEEPVDKIISYGTKERPVREAAYNTVRKANPDKYVDEPEVVITEGQPGQEQEQADGSWKIIQAPVDEVVEYGTKQRATREIPFQTIERENPDRYEDETPVVIQEGKLGLEKEVSEGTWEIQSEPIDKIVEIGSKKRPVVEEKVDETKEIPFATTKITNPNRYKDEDPIIKQAGKNGLSRLNDKGEWEVVIQPVEQIIEVGTKLRPTRDDQDSIPVPQVEESKEDTVRYLPFPWCILKNIDGTKIIVNTSSGSIVGQYPSAYQPHGYSYKLGSVPIYDILNNTSLERSEWIYVPEGYRTIGEGWYRRSDLLAKYNRLERALQRNRISVEAANYLLKYTPNTVAGVRGQLLDLISQAQILQDKASLVLSELDVILVK